MKKIRITTYIIFIFLLTNCFAGTKMVYETNSMDNHCEKAYFSLSLFKYVYKSTNEPPKYIGEDKELSNYIRKNFKPKPSLTGIQATIKVIFIVDSDGRIKQCKVLGKKKNDYTNFEKEFIDCLKSSPTWKPAKCNSKKVAFETGLVYRW